jgi:putative FmdB family regulatory protein
MPIYEYRCEACGHELEVIQKVSDAPLSDCPTCGESTLTKLVSAAGFQLKGSGWYVTDFKDSGKKKPEKSKSEPGDDKSVKADKAEAKTDKKVDADATGKSSGSDKKVAGG